MASWAHLTGRTGFDSLRRAPVGKSTIAVPRRRSDVGSETSQGSWEHSSPQPSRSVKQRDYRLGSTRTCNRPTTRNVGANVMMRRSRVSRECAGSNVGRLSSRARLAPSIAQSLDRAAAISADGSLPVAGQTESESVAGHPRARRARGHIRRARGRRKKPRSFLRGLVGHWPSRSSNGVD